MCKTIKSEWHLTLMCGSYLVKNFNHLFSASPPFIQETELQTEGEEGGMVSLQCIALGTPTPVIAWFKGDQKVCG